MNNIKSNIEIAILKDIAVNPSTFKDVAEIVNVDMFETKINKAIYNAIKTLIENDYIIDNYILERQIREELGKEKITGVDAYSIILTLYQSEYLTETPEATAKAEILREEYLREKGRGLMADAVKKLVNSINPELELTNFSNEIETLVKRDEESTNDDRSNAFMKKVNDYMINGYKGLDIGFKALENDTIIKGGEVAYVAARPAMGKTAFMLLCALSLARAGTPVYIFSLEMSYEMLLTRFASYMTGISSLKVIKGDLSQTEFNLILEAVEMVKDLPITVFDSVSTIEGVKRKMLALNNNGEEIAVFGDYLQLCTSEKGIKNRTLELGHITRAIKKIAKNFNAWMCWMVQLGRAVDQRPNKRPLLSDMRDSGTIEQDADLVACLFREEYYFEEEDLLNPDNIDKIGWGELILRKNRHGKLATYKRKFVKGKWILDIEEDVKDDEWALEKINISAGDIGRVNDDDIPF